MRIPSRARPLASWLFELECIAVPGPAPALLIRAFMVAVERSPFFRRLPEGFRLLRGEATVHLPFLRVAREHHPYLILVSPLLRRDARLQPPDGACRRLFRRKLQWEPGILRPIDSAKPAHRRLWCERHYRRGKQHARAQLNPLSESRLPERLGRRRDTSISGQVPGVCSPSCPSDSVRLRQE